MPLVVVAIVVLIVVIGSYDQSAHVFVSHIGVISQKYRRSQQTRALSARVVDRSDTTSATSSC